MDRNTSPRGSKGNLNLGLTEPDKQMLDQSKADRESTVSTEGSPKRGRTQNRRIRIPDRPQKRSNLWNLMRNSIGKDLSKIPMPVCFCEPLSMLQRLVEMLEYTSVLDKAAACSDCYERMAYVAAFSISAYSSTASRVLKPFNPLLGETYECDRITDLGWRAITEQVVHHPPVTAIHCESNAGWILSCDLTVQSKFRGKYLQITPIGTIHLLFRDGSCYTYNQVTTTVNNIILGKLWLDQMGDVEIIERCPGNAKCKLTYYPYNNYRKDMQRLVRGAVEDDAGNVRWTVTGKWDSRVELKKGIEGDEETMIGWERRPLASGSEKYYNFGQFTCQLNEPEMGVSPMDSRLRPDLRLMEEGQWDKADQMKAALEEAQRFRKRARDIGDLPPHNPLWFASKPSALTGQLYWQYKGGYWEAKEKKDWSFCPDIFTPIE